MAQSGAESSLNQRQLESLKKFRENISDILKPEYDDYFLLRWLRARNFDLQKSEQMLRTSLEWRKRIGADTILDEWEPPEVLSKYWPGGHCGYDKEGHPIWFHIIKDFDTQGLIKSVRKLDIIKFNVKRMELMRQVCQTQSLKLGCRVESGVQISDMSGFHVGQFFTPGVEVFNEVMKIFEANYPESLKTSYIINAPRIFPIIYNFLKPFLSDATKAKIKILGSDWKARLLETIDADQLPVNWGGTRTGPDGDIYCKDLICFGGEVPESYFHKENLYSKDDMTVLNVRGRASHDVEIPVKTSGSVIRWIFYTEENDIGFGVYFKPADGKEKELIPCERANTHMVPEDDSITCEHSGTYILRFDNTYSWVNSKKVLYKTEVFNPADEFLENGNDGFLKSKISEYSMITKL